MDFIKSELEEFELFFGGVEFEDIGIEIVKLSEGNRDGSLKNDNTDILELSRMEFYSFDDWSLIIC